LVKEKQLKRAIPHLERLLEGGGDEEDREQKDLLARLLGKALYETDTVGHEIGRLCKKFPDVREKLNDIRLEEAHRMMDRNEFKEVVRLLRQYKLHESVPQGQKVAQGYTVVQKRDSEADNKVYTVVQRKDPEAGSNVYTLVKLRLVLSSALIQSSEPSEALLMLGWVVAQPGLQPVQKCNAHSLLAEVYCTRHQWDNAKHHGMQSVQLNMDTLGRDHEFTSASILLMIYICSETSDPDEDLWRDMLPAGTRDVIAPLPSSRDSVQSCCFYMRLLAPQFKFLAAMVGEGYLVKNFDLEKSPAGSLAGHYRQVCWGCIRAHLLEGGGTLLAFKQGATCPDHAEIADGTKPNAAPAGSTRELLHPRT
jgi:hypothetical protein